MEERISPRYERAVNLLGKRWTALIVGVLLNGPCRFSELAAAIDVLSDRVLVARLRELEQAGIVQRRVHSAIPSRVEYILTPKGRDLEWVVRELRRWADRWDDYDMEDDIALPVLAIGS